MPDPSIETAANLRAAQNGREHLGVLVNSYKGLYNSWKTIDSTNMQISEVNAAHDGKLVQNEQKNNSYDRLSHYYGDIAKSNISITTTFKTIYYLLIVVFVIVVVLKKDDDPLNFVFVFALIILPILFDMIMKLIY